MSTDNRLQNGSCVACLNPTDTVLGIEGEAEWHIAFLTNLNIPGNEAGATVSAGTGNPPGMVPNGRYASLYRVCTNCAESASPNFPKPVLSLLGVDAPTLHQP